MRNDINFTLVTKTSALEELIKKYNTIEQAQFYITHLGRDFEKYKTEHRIYQNAKEKVLETLKDFGRVNILDRNYLPNYIFGEDNIVVVLGQDGLVANTMKYLTRQAVIGVNPDSKSFDGILLPFEPGDLKKIIPDILKNTRRVREITMAKASLNDGQELYAVNDLFIGPKTHTSARYSLHYKGISETQSSSGIIISTGLGSTGWLKSILKGAYGVVNTLYRISEIPNKSKDNIDREEDFQNKSLINGLTWETEKLIFSVREPFLSISSQADCVFGEISLQNPLKIISNMAENGVIFSDGIESDFLSFSSGIEALISVAKRKGYLVV